MALEAASRQAGRYPDGVWLVELAPLADGALVAQHVAATLGLTEQPGTSFEQAITAAIGARSVLLLLDNCEHLVDACASLAGTLVQLCPNVRLLATSREPLAIRGENVWRVASLSYPDAAVESSELLLSYEAPRLFLERARAVSPHLEMTPRSAPAVAQICQQLDGLPLAIELAAALVSFLSLDQITERLDRRFELLTGGTRTAPQRHRTLRELIDWSYELLPEPEQALFRRLSVFAGGWTLAAAEAVCAGGVVPAERVLELLGLLVKKSLVLAEERPPREMRYRLLETLRQYASEKLSSTEREAVGGAHAAYFVDLAKQARSASLGPEVASWLDRLEPEHDNFRAALQFLAEAPRSAPFESAGVRLAVALYPFWYLRNYWSEGRRWLEQFAGSADEPQTPVEAMAFAHLASLCFWMGDPDVAQTPLASEAWRPLPSCATTRSWPGH
ncbi:MAG TPA: hypothetical protein VF157_13755 [Chloroflexota bacterium]